MTDLSVRIEACKSFSEVELLIPELEDLLVQEGMSRKYSRFLIDLVLDIAKPNQDDVAALILRYC